MTLTQLGAELQAIRETCGLTRGEVRTEFEVERLEDGQGDIPVEQLVALLKFYESQKSGVTHGLIFRLCFSSHL